MMKLPVVLKAFCLLFFLVSLTKTGYCQNELGLPTITNYYYKDYDAAPINWWVLEDSRGVMYFANGAGVLEFDGETWRLIRNPGAGGARSMAMNEEGVIHVGFEGDLGVLASVGEWSHGI